MRIIETDRRFRILFHKKYASFPVEITRLLQESSAVGDYDDSMKRGGSSYLWVGQDHHLNREEVAELIGFMAHWLAHKQLPKETEATDGEKE